MQKKSNKSQKKRKVVMIISAILAIILSAVIGIGVALNRIARKTWKCQNTL